MPRSSAGAAALRENRREVWRLRDQGLSHAQIAERFGCDRGTVSALLRQGRPLASVGECVRLYRDEEMSLAEVARETGMNIESVRERLMAAGVERRPAKRREPRDGGRRGDQLEVLVRRLGSLTLACERLGVPLSTGHRWMERRGVRVTARPSRVWPRRTVHEVCERYQRGETLAALGKELGVSATAVRLLLQREGVPTRHQLNARGR